MSQNAEPNPVFKYRSAFRARANTAQKWLMVVGLALTVGGFGGALIFGRVKVGGVCLYCTLMSLGLAGGVLLIAGIAWGFYWRKKIRDEFRAKFGP